MTDSRFQFSDGDILYADQVNEIAYPRATGLPLLGHGDKITNDSLSDADNQIKAQFYSWYNRFRVVAATGLSVSISSGIVNSVGARFSIPPQTFTLTNNATTFLWIGKTKDDATILVRSSSSIPNNSIPLARVVTLNGAITQLEDIRQPAAEYLPPEIPQPVPVGSSMIGFYPPSVTSVEGYIEQFENIRLISRTEYSKLFALYGTYYSAGDNVTTFGIPGHGNALLRPAVDNQAIGLIAGSNQLTLTVNNLPPHAHTINDVQHSHGNNNAAHNHGISQAPHGHNANQTTHSHRFYGQQFDAGDASKNDGFQAKANVGIAGEDIGNIAYQSNNLSGIPIIEQVTPGVFVDAQNANISVNSATPNLTVLPSSTGINTTTNTGNGDPIAITPKSVTVRMFIKT